MTLHDFLDCNYGVDGDETLQQRIREGADIHAAFGANQETPLHVATRRRRKNAVAILLSHGAEINATTLHGKTAYAHAIRRGFQELVELLESHGADTELSHADLLAVAIVQGELEKAQTILAEFPEVARTDNPEDDRLLADVAGRSERKPVELLIAAGANLAAPGLDGGTPLHQAAWFGQPTNVRLLVEAGAPLNLFDPTHESSPLGWAVHGSRYSGGAEERQEVYVELVQLLLNAGSQLHYPDQPQGTDYRDRLLNDATPRIKELLEVAG